MSEHEEAMPEVGGVESETLVPESEAEMKDRERQEAMAKEAEQRVADLVKEIGEYDSDEANERVAKAQEAFGEKAQGAQERAAQYMAQAEVGREALAAMRSRFEKLDSIDDSMGEEGVATAVGSALEEHFGADMDKIMDVAAGMSPGFMIAANMRDGYKAVMEGDDERSGRLRRIWKRVARVNPLLAPLEYGYRLAAIAATDGEKRSEHVKELKDFAAESSVLWKLLLKDTRELIEEGRLRAQMAGDALAIVAPLAGGLGVEVAAAVKIGGKGMETFSKRLGELKKRAESGEVVTKGDLAAELLKAAVEVTGKAPEELMELAATAAIGSGKVDSEAAKVMLELVKDNPGMGVEMLRGIDRKRKELGV